MTVTLPYQRQYLKVLKIINYSRVHSLIVLCENEPTLKFQPWLIAVTHLKRTILR